MKKIIIVIFCGIAVFVESFVESKEKDDGSSWINVQYIECLKNHLPCECAKNVETNVFLSIDTKNHVIMLNKYGQMEPYIYHIRKIKLNEYEVINWDESILAKLSLKNDTLYFISGSIHSKFIQSEITKQYDIQHYYKDNVYLLNKAFVARGYPRLEQIINHNHESLGCDCNPWIGNINLLSVKGKPLLWVIFMANDSLYIEKVINKEDNDPDDPIQTAKFVSYKW